VKIFLSVESKAGNDLSRVVLERSGVEVRYGEKIIVSFQDSDETRIESILSWMRQNFSTCAIEIKLLLNSGRVGPPAPLGLIL
jgi:hypothetical protein